MFFLHIVAAMDFVNGDFFEQLYEKYSDNVYRIAYSYVNNAEDAKDLVQETFFKIYRHIGDFESLKPEETIALIVIYTKHNAIDFLRKKKRRIHAISLYYETDDEDVREFEIPDPDETPEEVVIRQENSEQLRKYVDSLPETQREVLTLKYRYGMKEKDIGRILHVDESAVSSRINRAKVRLRKMIEEEQKQL